MDKWKEWIAPWATVLATAGGVLAFIGLFVLILFAAEGQEWAQDAIIPTIVNIGGLAIGLTAAALITFRAAEHSAQPTRLQALATSIRSLEDHRNDLDEFRGKLQNILRNNSAFLREADARYRDGRLDSQGAADLLIGFSLPFDIKKFTYLDEHLNRIASQLNDAEQDICFPETEFGQRANEIHSGCIKYAGSMNRISGQLRRTDEMLANKITALRAALSSELDQN